MEKERLKEICSVLESYNRQYCLADKKRKDGVEKNVRSYVKTLPDELYLELNEGAANGLCRHGFFESDLSECIRILKNKLNE
ncbi:MAG: hypothetical protein IJ456_08885 [Bacteroides sp.]|nr:hypothetical protein [Bacteroides sp.]